MTITGSTDSLPVVRSALARMAELEGMAAEDIHKITLAVDEALANVIKHGYGGPCDKPIHIKLEGFDEPDGRGGIRVEVRDHGRQVDPHTIKGRDLDDVRPGGLGVHIMRTVMDKVEFSCPIDGGMHLEMVKYRDGGARKPGDAGARTT